MPDILKFSDHFVSPAIRKLRARLETLLADDADMIGRCSAAIDLDDRLRAELKRTPKPEWASIRARLEAAGAEIMRLGGLAGELDARIAGIRAEIAAGE